MMAMAMTMAMVMAMAMVMMVVMVMGEREIHMHDASFGSMESYNDHSSISRSDGSSSKKVAYGTIVYMGTPRDYEFYVAARVLLQSLTRRLRVHADVFVLASLDIPHQWAHTFLSEGVRVIRVPNIRSPFEDELYFNPRFKFSLNKLYAWRLVEYERIVMLDVDNIFLRDPHELFLCGQFCAVFIDPCIFHTGLFVLEPSNKVFNDMNRFLSARNENIDGADQGFLTSYFRDLLEKPLFQTPTNTTSRLSGYYRLPLGYQMDASYYYLRLKWRVPCGLNSVVTFPSASWLKPWYWWSWPVLPLGLSWHSERRSTIGYVTESRVLLAQSFLYSAMLVLTSAAWLGLIPSSFIHRDGENIHRWSCVPKQFWLRHEPLCLTLFTRVLPPICMVISFMFPMWVIPTTSHPMAAWAVFLLGSFSMLVTMTILLHLEFRPVLTPWILTSISLLVMAFPFYSNGIVRMLSIFSYGAFSTPFFWWSLKTISMAPSTNTQGKDQASIKRNPSD